jgi:Domain of unknown function (DUF5666)
MPDHYEDHPYENETLTGPEYEEPWEPPTMDAELPPRPRRRLVTPVRAGLAALLVAGAGFLGGVEVQKSQASGGGSAATSAFARAGGAGAAAGGGGAAAGPGGFGGQADNATVGSVKSKNGNWLYVQDSGGNTVKVRTTSTSKVTRTAKSSASAIHPGDRVIVQGTKSSSGTITATQITATSSLVQGGPGGGLFGGGFGAGRGGTAPSGAGG